MTQLLIGSRLRKWGSALLVIGICLLTAATSQAVSLYWNPPGGGTGNWNTVDTLWSTDDLNLNAIWSNAGQTPGYPDDAIFAHTAGTVTVDAGGITVENLTFNTANYVIAGGTLTLAGTTPTITAASNANISAAIAGTLGLTKAGAGQLTLSASGGNTYTGDTTITAGTLLYSNTNQLSAGGTNNIVFNGGTLGTLAGVTEARNITMTTAGTIDTWGVDSTFSGVISGSGALTKAGNGALTLSGNSAGYAAQININGGSIAIGSAGASKLIIGNANALGTGAINLNGGTIDTGIGALSLANPVMWSGNFGFGGSANLTFSNVTDIPLTGSYIATIGGTGNTLKFNARIMPSGTAGDRGVLVNGAGNTLELGGMQLRVAGDTTWRTVWLGNSATSAGAGNIIFNGPLVGNGASGTTGGEPFKVGTGTVTFAGSVANNYPYAATRIAQGTLVLDYTLGNVDKLTDGAELRGYGVARLDLKGAASPYTEVVSAFRIGNTTGNSRSGVLHITRSSGLATIRLNSLTIDQGGFLDVAVNDIADTDTTNTSGILAPGSRSSVTVGGVDWGFNSTNAADGFIEAYANYNTGAETTWDTATNNGHVSLSGGAAMTAARTINTLKISTTGAGQSLDIGSANALQLNLGGLLFAGADDYSINNGTIRPGQNPGDVLIITNGAGKLTINSVIANNSTYASRLNKAGSGILLLNGPSTFTGQTAVSEGTLQLGSDTIAGTSGPLGTGVGNLVVGVGAMLDLNGHNLTVAQALSEEYWGGRGMVVNNSGSGTATLTVGYNNAAWGSGILIADNTTGSGKVAVTKVGTGQWQINVASTYTGGTTISGGLIRMQVSNPFGSGTVTMNGGRIWFPSSGGPWTLSNDFYINDVAGNAIDYDQSGSNMTMSGSISGPGAVDMTYWRDNQNYNYSGDLTGFTGTLIIGKTGGSGTYNYNLQRSGAVQGSASANFYFGSTGTNAARLRYNGTGNATVYLGGLNASTGGTTAYGELSNNVANTTATFEIGGRNNANDAFAGVIANGAGTTALRKVGTGTLTLSGNNTYTGATTVNSGTLLIQGALASPTLTVNGGNLTLDTASSLTGATQAATINGGVLTAKTGTSLSLANMSATVNGGGALKLAVSSNGSYPLIGSVANGGITVAGGSSPATQGVLDLTDGMIGNYQLASPSTAALTLGGGTAGNPSLLDFDFGAVSGSYMTDNITIGGGNNLLLNPGGAVVNITGIPGFGISGTSQDFPLINYNSKSGGGAFTLGTTPPSLFTYSLIDTGSVLNLHVTGNPVPIIAYWRGDVNSVWNGYTGSNTNWATDSTGGTDTAQLPGSSSTVYFAASNVSGSGPINTTLGQDFGIYALNFNSTVGPSRPVTIGGTNTLGISSGGITVDSGSGAHTISTAGVVLSASQSWANYSSNPFTVAAPISGDSLTFLSITNGLFVFSGSGSTFSGYTNIQYGSTVRIGSPTALGTSQIALEGTLDLNGITFDAGGLSGGGTVTNNNVTPATLSFSGAGGFGGTIKDGAGTVGVRKSGAGTASLSGTNTYTGVTTLNGGALNIASAGAIGTAGDVKFTGGTLQYSTGITTDFSARIKGSTSPIAIDVGGQDITLAGDIDSSNTGGFNAIAGTNTLTLSGNNSFTGTFALSSGKVKVGSNTALGAASGALTLAGNTVLDLNGHTVQKASVSLGGYTLGMITNTDTANPAVFDAPILNYAGTLTLDSPGDLALQRVQSNAGNRELIWNSAATLTLGTANSTGHNNLIYLTVNNGGTVLLNMPAGNLIAIDRTSTINDGLVKITGASTNQIQDGTSLVFGTGATATFDINGHAETIGYLSGGSPMAYVQNSAVGTTTALTLDVRGDASFAGTIRDNDGVSGGVLAITKIGDYAQDLSGVNTYTGPTNINNGKLSLSGGGSIANSSAINIGSAGTFDVSGTSSPYATGVGQTISGSGSIVGAYTHAQGTIVPGGAGTAGTLTFDNTVAGGTVTISGGAINFDASSSTSAGNDLIVLSGGTGSLSGAVTVNVGTGLGYVLGGTYTVISQPSGTFTPAIGGWTATWDRRGANPTLAATANSVTVTLPAAIGPAANLKWSGATSGAWDVVTTQNWYNSAIPGMDKYYRGDNVTFSDTYNGVNAPSTTDVMLNISASPSAVTCDANSLNYSISGTGSIAGATGLVKSGAGTLTLNTVNTYSGDTIVNGGALVLTRGGAAGTIRSTLTVNTTGTVSLTAVDALGYTAGTQVPTVNLSGGTIDNATTGNQAYRTNFVLTGGHITSTGGGLYNFTTGYGIASNASSTTATITAGLLARDNSTLNFNVASGTTSSGVDLDVSGAIQGSNGISKSGSGKLLLSGANTYTGATTVNGGVLALASTGQLLSASAISTAATATFEVDGGTHTVGAISGAGTTALAAGANLTATSVVQGALTLGAGATLTIAPIPGGPLSGGAGSLTAVPEPSTWAMLILAAMGMGIYWRRSR